MGRKKTRLTAAELRVMDVLWERGESTVAEVVAVLPPPPLAYTTVLTMLRTLEQKFAVSRTAAGRAHRYRPTIARDDAASSAVGDVVRNFFANSKTALAVRLIEQQRPTQAELDSIKALIARYEEERSQ